MGGRGVWRHGRGIGRRGMLLVAVTAALVAGCATSGTEGGGAAPGTSARTGSTAVATTAAAAKGGGPFGPVVEATVADLQRYWGTTLPAVGGAAYRPLADDALHPFDADRLPPSCDGQPVSYEQLQRNAFYCRSRHFVAWDEGTLFPELARLDGVGAVALVLAHEWGHAVQDQAGIDGDPLVLELQADCFAGMWLADIQGAPAGTVLRDIADRGNDAMAGLLGLADSPGTSSRSREAHGSGFDRTRAFRDGFEGKRCFDYARTPPAVVQLDLPPGRADSHLGFDEARDRAGDSLNRWFAGRQPGFAPISDLLPFDHDDPPTMTCGGQTWTPQLVKPHAFILCPSERWIAYDAALLRRAHEAFGDGAVMTLLATQWSGMAAGMAAASPGFDLFAGVGRRECEAGRWLHDVVVGGDADLQLGAADIDEGIAGVLSTRTLPGSGTSGGLVDGLLAVRGIERGYTGVIEGCLAGDATGG